MTSIPFASAWFHAVHYGIVFGIPVLTLAVLAIATGRNPPQPLSDEEVARREQQMLLSFGQLAPSRTTVASPPRAPRTERTRTLAAAAVVLASLSAGAGLIHAAVISIHFRQDWIYGVFFIVSAIAQLVWAVLVLRGAGRGLLVAGAVGNALIIALWIVSRTSGLPFGPEPGVAESLGWAGGIASAYEGVIVALCLMQLGRETRFTAKVTASRAAAIGIALLAAAGAAGIAGHTG